MSYCSCRLFLPSRSQCPACMSCTFHAHTGLPGPPPPLNPIGIATRVLHNGLLHYTAWALVKTVEHSTIQLSLVGLTYCIIPYLVYCFGLALSLTNTDSYLSYVTHNSTSTHLSSISLFIPCHSLQSKIYHISYTVKNNCIKSVKNWH
jgi:hypothetical protein